MRIGTSRLLPLFAFAITLVVSKNALADVRVEGKVDRVGTLSELKMMIGDAERFQARFRFLMIESTCDTDPTPKERWIHVNSGRMDGIFAHNAANFRVAYSTVMTALLARKVIEVFGATDCIATTIQTIDLWNSSILLRK